MDTLLSSIPELSGIYKITCTITNKIYIGQTKNLRKRYLQYKGAETRIDNTFRSKRPIIYAIRKYGFSAFIFEVIELTTDLNTREVYWIKELNSTDKSIGYNVEKGGAGRQRIAGHLSDDARYRMGSRNRGKKISEDTLRRRKETREALGQNFKVMCVEDNLIFDSLKSLREYYAKKFNCKPTSIHASEVINGKRQKDHGLTFCKC